MTSCLGMRSHASCDSPQYLQLGHTGTVNCIFQENYFGIYWYNTSDYSRNQPVLHYQNFVKSGIGYTTGEFDIHRNGSLIINNATFQHDTTFKVAYVRTPTESPTLVDVVVIIIVRPTPPFPSIDSCGSFNQTCYILMKHPFQQCSLHHARPKIDLRLMIRTVKGDKLIATDNTTMSDGIAYTSRVTTVDVFHYSSLLALLICKASSPPGMLENNYSFALIQNGLIDLSSQEKTLQYIERYMEMELLCPNNDMSFLVWKKARVTDNSEPDVLLYSVYNGEPVTRIFADGFVLGVNGSLSVPRVEITHEGLYFCLIGNGTWESINLYEVVVVVYPNPAYPVIEGCDHQRYCVLEAAYESSLTCTLRGIRPQVELGWETLYNDDAASISFTNHRFIVKDNGGTYDVSLTSTIHVRHGSFNRVTLQCKVQGIDSDVLGLSTKVDLLFVKEEDITENTTATQQVVQRRGVNVLLIIPIAVVVLCVVIVVCGLFVKKFKEGNNIKSEAASKTDEKEEKAEMLAKSHPEADSRAGKREEFIKQLKGKYCILCGSLQPVPFLKDMMYRVSSVFVENIVEDLGSLGDDTGHEGWKHLDFYENILDNFGKESTRRILEGGPGYGKTTLTLQLTDTWCHPSSSALLKDVEVLIYLEMRQLEGVKSIYTAIKQFILPTESRLSEDDIQQILLDSRKTVIILDGFDEYPHPHESEETSHFLDIISGEMFREFIVLLTTRTSILPKKCPPQTKRFRLTGFDKNARDNYIRKVVSTDHEKAVNDVEKLFERNPILNDLCQVPMLFVIIAHMAQKHENFLKLHSATSFFRYVISSFHSHMKNKLGEENVDKYDLGEDDHSKLDKEAFKALSDSTRSIVWYEQELSGNIGNELYQTYVDIGILKEECIVDISDDPSTPITEHIKTKKKVRFQNKLFCEWYAAHYLSVHIEENPSDDLNNLLQNLDPNDVHYLYRFSCGLSKTSEERIVQYLQTLDDGDKFVILCLLEQTGQIDRIRDSIRRLCFEGVIISGHDSLILQRAHVLLLEIASLNKIPIEYVCLHNCVQSVDASRTTIITSTGLAFSNTVAVKWLIIELSNRDMSNQEARHLIKFSLNCKELKILQFNGCVPPRSFKTGKVLSSLESRNIQVRWSKYTNSEVNILNLRSGKWERGDDGSEVKPIEFKMTKLLNLDIRQRMTTDDYRNMINKTREEIRQWSLQHFPEESKEGT